MRFSQANWITIDDADRTLVCERCSTITSLAGEPFGVLGFVRVISRLARGHFRCADPGRQPYLLDKNDDLREPSPLTLDASDTQWGKLRGILSPEDELEAERAAAAGAGGVQ